MKLYLFTSAYPNGIHELWKEDEINILKEKFDSINIIPFAFSGELYESKELPENIFIHEPFFRNSVFIKPGVLLKLFSHRIGTYFTEFFCKRVFLSKQKMISFLDYVYRTELMLDSKIIQSLLKEESKSDTVLYFYWGVGGSFVVPFLKGFKNIVVRFHGFDLYEERNHGYFPFREKILAKMRFGVFVSGNGLQYMSKRYPGFQSKFRLFRIGTRYEGKAIPSSDNILRIVSCSSVIALKRVQMILKALTYLTIEVEWTHLGQGELWEELVKESQSLKKNIKVNLPGHIDSNKVKSFYVGRAVDLFLNVSTTEGVPVSIMEAFSASIPVMATDVGGTGEIVDEAVGLLLPKDITPKLLSEELLSFYNLPALRKRELRINGYKRFRKMCDSDKLNNEFAEFLVNE